GIGFVAGAAWAGASGLALADAGEADSSCTMRTSITGEDGATWLPESAPGRSASRVTCNATAAVAARPSRRASRARCGQLVQEGCAGPPGIPRIPMPVTPLLGDFSPAD